MQTSLVQAHGSGQLQGWNWAWPQPPANVGMVFPPSPCELWLTDKVGAKPRIRRGIRGGI
jgi:hypothetical protein